MSPEKFEVVLDPPSHRTVIWPGEMALKRLLKYGLTISEKLVCVALVTDSGLVRMWSPTISGEDQKSWLRRRLDDVYELATKESVNG